MFLLISSQDFKPVHYCSQSSCLDPCASYVAGVDAVEDREIVVDDVSRGVQSHGIVAGVDGCHGGPSGARLLKSWSDEDRCHLRSVAESLQRWLVDISLASSPSATDKSQRSLSCSCSTLHFPGRMTSSKNLTNEQNLTHREATMRQVARIVRVAVAAAGD